MKRIVARSCVSLATPPDVSFGDQFVGCSSGEIGLIVGVALALQNALRPFSPSALQSKECFPSVSRKISRPSRLSAERWRIAFVGINALIAFIYSLAAAAAHSAFAPEPRLTNRLGS